MSNAYLIASLFKYKSWANEEILAAMQQLNDSNQQTELHTAIRIMNHTYVVDRIFAAHLLGEPHNYTATNTVETPKLNELCEVVQKSDHWYSTYVSTVTLSELNEKIRFKFTDGDTGCMSREEILLHIVTHGGYHRGAVGHILAQLNIAPPRDLYSGYLHKAEATRRSG
jgi:uncharacterized damage-inducible protein DinB